MAEYLVLIYGDETRSENVEPGTCSTASWPATGSFGRSTKWRSGGATPYSRPGPPRPSARTIRGGFTVTDGAVRRDEGGPGGYYLIEAADLDEALGSPQVPGPLRRRRGPPDPGLSTDAGR